MSQLLPAWSATPKPVIGMLHLLPLPGAPGFGGDIAVVLKRLLDDAAALAEGGVHGLMVENFGDAPFYPGRVPAIVIAHMTRLAAEVRRRFDLPLGINVLRNDGRSALSVAHAVGAEFIRVNVLCGARVTDQGILQGIAHKLLRDRAALTADVRIFADVSVKHSAPVGPPRPIEDEIADTLHRGRADALVLSGRGTGQATELGLVRQARAAAGGAPVFIGSGISPKNIAEYRDLADGFIIGSSLKQDGRPSNPIDARRVRELIIGLA